jgi:hypothetical protein
VKPLDNLRKKLESLIAELDEHEEIAEQMRQLESVYPFNAFEYMIATLIGKGKLSLADYYELRKNYIENNRYLGIFEISAPRGFGEKWAQNYLHELVPQLKKPSKKLDPNYSGQYDFFLENIKIEVKASRAVDFNSKEPLYVKALSSNSPLPFNMNFQQIKPGCCDVFVWIAVWRDVIRYWVLSSKEVEMNPYYSTGQHRGNVGEGQLHLNHENIDEFSIYECHAEELYEKILAAKERNDNGLILGAQKAVIG